MHGGSLSLVDFFHLLKDETLLSSKPALMYLVFLAEIAFQLFLGQDLLHIVSTDRYLRNYCFNPILEKVVQAYPSSVLVVLQAKARTNACISLSIILLDYSLKTLQFTSELSH